MIEVALSNLHAYSLFGDSGLTIGSEPLVQGNMNLTILVEGIVDKIINNLLFFSVYFAFYPRYASNLKRKNLSCSFEEGKIN